MTDVEIHFNAPEGASPEELDAYLDKACEGDAALRARVEALFAAEAEVGSSFMEAPPLEADMTVSDETPLTEGPGTQIGRYKLLEQIGEGGFGVVYMAEQREPVVRRVALKIIKLGMDTKQVVARFEAERQALALMQHPNIAKVLDGGSTETGRPYFVMELVRGVPITEYCDKNKLSTRERLDLFIPVCQAIQHAHQKGVIHRDIKPNNVLVTLNEGVPHPMVIDFGVAKAINQRLTEKTLFTNYGQMIGTPAYMSPEQAGMSKLDVDTRTDVYSLGVLLYELLTGTTPFSAKELLTMGYGEIQKTLSEVEPPNPSARFSTLQREEQTAVAKNRSIEVSALGRLFRGDLNWIVMKALDKARTRRYATVNALVSDVRRHLNNEPVTAVAPTLGYQLRKFYRRNKGYVGVAAIVAVLLMVAGIFSGYMAIRATLGWKAAESGRGRALELKLQAQEDLAVSEALRDEAEDQKTVVETAARTQAIRVHESELNLDELGYQGDVTEPLFHAQQLIELEPENSKWSLLKERLLASHIPARDPNLPRHLIDLSDYYNANLHEVSEGTSDGGISEDNHLAELNPGLHTFDNVDFDIRGIVKVGGDPRYEERQRVFSYPSRIPGIQLDQVGRMVHFIHAFAMPSGKGRYGSGFYIGAYTVHYTDKSSVRIDLLAWTNIASWWRTREDTGYRPKDAKTVWTGENERTRHSPSLSLAIYKFSWSNPNPKKMISHIDFESARMSPIPFLLAITVEQ